MKFKNAAALALILTALSPAAAQETAVSTAAVQASTAAAVIPLPPERTPALRRLMKDLNLLLQRGGELPPARLNALDEETVKFGEKVREALGREMLEDAARSEEADRAAAAKKALAGLRRALQLYYAANGAKYPASPADLVPAQLPEVPELDLPGHQASAAVAVIDSKKYDKDASEAVKDSGGWLYFSSPESSNYGLLLIDCGHRAPGGEEFYKY